MTLISRTRRISPGLTEYDTIYEQVIDHVVARLLGVLDIKPSRVHFDLWEGKTGKVLVFDPAGLCVWT